MASITRGIVRVASIFVAARLYILALPTFLTFSGAAMNQAVIVANGGAMPVQVNDESAKKGGMFEIQKNGFFDERHRRMTSNTRLNCLGDYINLGMIILSPGDCLIFLGESLVTYAYCAWITLAIADYARKNKVAVD